MDDMKAYLRDTIMKLKEELIELTAKAVQINSITPTYPGISYTEAIGGESRVNGLYKEYMESFGLVTDSWEAEEKRANLAGTYKGTGNGKSLLFNGHVDVVPPGPLEKWTEASPWSGLIRDNKIWGRGSCDMKGGNSAVLVALKALHTLGYKPKGDIHALFVVGEEMMNTQAGTLSAIDRGYSADGGIVVEPSSPPYRLGLAPASPGALYMICTIPGKAGHASMRHQMIRPGGNGEVTGVSSIDKAFIIYQGLRLLEEEWGQTKSHPLYPKPGHFTIHPGVISGGNDGAFIISEESRIEYAIWYPPHEAKDKIIDEIEAQVNRFADTDPWLRKNPPKINWLIWWPPYDVPPESPICRTIAGAYENSFNEKIKYYGFSGNNDAAFLNQAGIPTVTIGPGDLTRAHKANEHVCIDELIDASILYARTIIDWCGSV